MMCYLFLKAEMLVASSLSYLTQSGSSAGLGKKLSNFSGQVVTILRMIILLNPGINHGCTVLNCLLHHLFSLGTNANTFSLFFLFALDSGLKV